MVTKSTILALSDIFISLLLNNSKVIKNVNDLPAPVGGVITLAQNQSYVIDGEINIGTNQIAQLDDSFNTFISTDPFAVGGGGGQIVYEGTDAMFVTSGKRSSYWFKAIGLLAPNGKIFDLGDNWQLLPSTSVTNTTVTTATDHNLSVNDRVRFPNVGTGIGEEYFYVESITSSTVFEIHKPVFLDFADNTDCYYSLLNEEGGSVLADISLIIANDIGTIQNYGFLTVSFAAVGCGQGYDLINVGRTNFSFLQWTDGQNLVGGTALSLRGVMNNFSVNSGNYIQPKSNEAIMYVDPQSTLQAGVVTGVSFDSSLGGLWFRNDSLDQTDPYWKYSGNSGIEDSEVKALVYLNNNISNTTISAINTPVKIAGSWIEGNTERFLLSSDRLNYTGIEKAIIDVVLIATVEPELGVEVTASLYIAKNGTPIISSRGRASAKNDTQVTCLANISVETDDYIEAWIENNTGTQNILVSYATLQVH
jgi:hypothetical protein